MKSTLRLPGLKAVACSGLTLSGASLPRLQRRGLAPPNGSQSEPKSLHLRSFSIIFLLLPEATKRTRANVFSLDLKLIIPFSVDKI
jgi:hypothetical protein